MTEKNQHINEYLEYYTSLSEGPQFAVLITGAWGSGKTWLVRNYFAKHASKQDLYISLYGASSADDVADRIFAAMHPILSSKYAVIAGRIVKGLVKTTIQIDLDGDGKSDGSISSGFPDKIDGRDLEPRYGGRTLILDDIERCTLGSKELWGFINRLVEHEKVKVILISHEDEISESDREYRHTKEKNIGITLTVEPDSAGALEAFTVEMSETCRSKIHGYTDEILQIFDATDCRSLRVLRFAVRDICRILGELDADLLLQSTVMSDLIQTSTAMAVGFHGNLIDTIDDPSIDPHLSPSTTDSQDGGISKEKPKPHEYLIDLGIFSRAALEKGWWRDFFNRGIIDRPLLNSSLRARYLDDMPDWYRLSCFDTLEEADFNDLMAKTWSDLCSDKLRLIGPILHVAGVHIWAFSQQLTQRDPAEVAAKTIGALNALTSEEILDGYDARRLQRRFHSYRSIVFAGEENSGFQQIVSHAKELEKEAINEKTRRISHSLMEHLRHGNGDGFARAIELDTEGTDGDFSRFSVGQALAQARESEFADILLGLSTKEQEKVLGGLSRRSRHMGPEAREWLAKVVHEIESRTRTIRTVMLTSYLRQVCD